MYLILLAAAVIPAVYLMLQVHKLDALEKEPPGLLWSLAILGVAATALASFTEQAGDLVLAWFLPEESVAYKFLLYFVVVAVSEEGFKYLLMKNRTWRSQHFDCLFDGVVYAVFVSLGFALWENIAYVFTYGFGAAVARALTAVPGHASFGVFMGTWYGLAKRYEEAGLPAQSKAARRKALWVPVLLHGAYDFIASVQETGLTLIFVVFVLGMFVAALRTVKRQAAADHFLRGDPTEY